MATSRGGPAASSHLVVLPSYPQMIVEAIASLREDNGSSQAAIARRIEAAHGAAGDLPPSHPALVAAHLSRMAAAAELVALAGGKYALPTPPSRCPAVEQPDAEELDDDDSPDDDSPDHAPLPPPPAKRGRGRPPKVRPPGFPISAPAGTPIGAPTSTNGLPVPAAAPAAPRRRGRPPKPRDPLAPPKVARPRGRPRKNPLPDGMVQIPRPGSTAAKPRAQFAEVGFV
ncbi:HMG-Y-related protein A-like [Lolium rigidum]|uniref:HMG-Y-related protein A-like n=1 Tax=Lolium rigidum TaxID=89674 RepID=UPI001F5D2110|nr:HMG-Y-related protein A-like [Lolium rigidum]